MRLNDPLVTSFVYGDKEYDIDLAFDVVLDVFDVMEDENLFDHEKASIQLEILLNKELYGAEAIELFNYIFKEFIEFEREKRIEYDLKGNPMPIVEDEDDKKLVDFEKDASYIVASFQQAYGIDLYEQQGIMHWHRFKALFQGLPSDTVMKWIMQVRAWEPSKGESEEHKQRMRELQRQHSLSKEVD